MFCPGLVFSGLVYAGLQWSVQDWDAPAVSVFRCFPGNFVFEFSDFLFVSFTFSLEPALSTLALPYSLQWLIASFKPKQELVALLVSRVDMISRHLKRSSVFT